MSHLYLLRLSFRLNPVRSRNYPSSGECRHISDNQNKHWLSILSVLQWFSTHIKVHYFFGV